MDIMGRLEKVDRINQELSALLTGLGSKLRSDPDLIIGALSIILNELKTWAILISEDGKIMYVNPALKEYLAGYGVDSREGRCYKPESWFTKKFGWKDLPACPIFDTIKSREIHTAKITAPLSGHIYDIFCVPLLYNGTAAVLVLVRLENDG